MLVNNLCSLFVLRAHYIIIMIAYTIILFMIVLRLYMLSIVVIIIANRYILCRVHSKTPQAIFISNVSVDQSRLCSPCNISLILNMAHLAA